MKEDKFIVEQEKSCGLEIENYKLDKDILNEKSLKTSEISSFSSFKDKACHKKDKDWLLTPLGDKRGYIEARKLKELWIHTGTLCNLSCPFCFEGGSSNRIENINLDDVKSFIDEALTLDIELFSFTGGEPFMNKEFIDILDYALDHKPCFVLTNATKPLSLAFDKIKQLKNKPHSLSFRVSIDSPREEIHDKCRGKGNFVHALENCSKLISEGFQVSIAGQTQKDKNHEELKGEYKILFEKYGIPLDTLIISFPDLLTPFQKPVIPYITEDCMTRYKTKEEREKFMCAYSAMIAKKKNKIHIYPCTLVDDDDEYNMASNLHEILEYKIMLKHHRCYICFSSGTSCSEI